MSDLVAVCRLSRAVKQLALLGFAARVRTGCYGKNKQVGVQTVESSLRYVAQAIVLAGHDDPRKTYGSKDLDLPFQRLLKAYRNDDPAPQPQVALPVHTIEWAATTSQRPGASPLASATGDLITMAFYFLLRVGEYTMPSRKRRTRTVQFRCKDVIFRRNQEVIPHTAPIAHLLSADTVTLWLDNQKNGQRGGTLHHTATSGPFCPVKALARRIKSIATFNMPPDTPLSYVCPGRHVTSADIVAAVKVAVKASGLLKQGYRIQQVGSHSLRHEMGFSGP